MSGRRLVSSCDAVATKKQHRKPCSDCPWARKSLPGWLGGVPPERWVSIAHSEDAVGCHTQHQPNGHDWDCAGLATYRANVCKTPRDPKAFVLKANRELVFSSPAEFLAHHVKEKT